MSQASVFRESSAPKFRPTRWEITIAVRAALLAHPRCSCGAPAAGQVWLAADISRWQDFCESHLEAARAAGAIVREWSE